MADLSDCTAWLAAQIGAILYPAGATGPSITGDYVSVFEGWPDPQTLDHDMRGTKLDNGQEVPNTFGQPRCNVSIYPTRGAQKIDQAFDESFIQVPAVHGLVAVGSPTTLTLSGAPLSPDEFVTVALNGKIYSRLAASLNGVLNALFADIVADFPLATLSGATVMIPNALGVSVSVGSSAIVAFVTRRQAKQVMISIWTPDVPRRNRIAKAIDGPLKAMSESPQMMADGSTAYLHYVDTNVSDDAQTQGIYRRDLIYSIQYDTIETEKQTEITAFVVNGIVTPHLPVPPTPPLPPIGPGLPPIGQLNIFAPHVPIGIPLSDGAGTYVEPEITGNYANVLFTIDPSF